MCRTFHSILGTLICALQMLVRVMMTVILLVENLIRMLLQTIYNFISFMLQLISLIPICVVFLATSRLKCLMCGGGGPCPVNRGGTCDCLMSAVAIIILFFIFRATGLLDKIFYKIGYAKATPEPFTRYVPTPGDITECSREDDTETTLPPETTETTRLPGPPPGRLPTPPPKTTPGRRFGDDEMDYPDGQGGRGKEPNGTLEATSGRRFGDDEMDYPDGQGGRRTEPNGTLEATSGRRFGDDEMDYPDGQGGRGTEPNGTLEATSELSRFFYDKMTTVIFYLD